MNKSRELSGNCRVSVLVMEVTDLNELQELLNVRAIKMEQGENGFDENAVENSDPLSIIPQYVTESDLGKEFYL